MQREAVRSEQRFVMSDRCCGNHCKAKYFHHVH